MVPDKILTGAKVSIVLKLPAKAFPDAAVDRGRLIRADYGNVTEK
jgi:hypothetical protein